ncbi:WD repeat and HMG-box DNA-binding protein 1-like [Oppia nitens]|uniref:WD repeat and HMG-box DNA-binding protein 1-like n=1 Tax=Oppia nitens TaxID=1686743 RepID=UPI0023DB3045|nr:WD repeat and HMG-box DNA-binding protein 1-like [Oppia nitens]
MSEKINDNVDCVIRFGHCEGHTDCFFVSDRKLLTCGVDSEIRRWPVNEVEDDNEDDDESDSSFPVEDIAYAIVANSTNFFIACDTNCVKSFRLSDGEEVDTVCRFTTNATHLDIGGNDGQLLVASAADFTLKSIDLTTSLQKTYEGHEAPVLSVSLDPRQQFISSASCDGTVRVWNVDTKTCCQSWTDCLPKSNDFETSPVLCRMSWQPSDGQRLAVPKMDRIDVHARDTWQLVATIRHDLLKQISIVSYSPDGNYLAAASSDGVIMIWNITAADGTISLDNTSPMPIAKYFHKDSAKITCLKWCPRQSQLAFCDISGHFGVISVKSLHSLQNTNNTSNNINNTNTTTGTNNNHNNTNDNSNKLVLNQEEMNNMFADLSDDDFGDNDDPKADNADVDIELPNITFNKKYIPTKDIVSINEDNNLNTNDGNDVNDDDDVEFDIGALKARYESQINSDAPKDRPSEQRPNSRLSHQSKSREVVQEVEEEEEEDVEPPPLRQEPFQSGSTPVHYDQRFMVWNSVGIVRCYNTENESSIDVEFHDVAYHHSIHVPNKNTNYTMADLSPESLIMATNGDERATGGKLYCRLFNIWDATKEWSVDMTSGEFIEAVTCGTGFIAAATDKRFVRIFTVGGIQTNVLSLPGRVVSLASFEQLLMIVYHSASGLPDEQSLSMYVLRVVHKPTARHPVPNPVPVALTPKSPVYWAGFTDEGTPCVVDFDGQVRLFKTGYGNMWIPVANTKDHAKGKSDNFFIIGLSEIQNQIRCLFCKGSRYPATVPKPTVNTLPLQIPVCESHTAKGKNEEENIRNQLLASLLKKLSKDGFDVETNYEECQRYRVNALVKLFAMSLAADRESLALEVSRLMPNEASVVGAIRFAQKQQRMTLIEKLKEIALQKHEEEVNGESDDEEAEAEVQEIVEVNTQTSSTYRIQSLESQQARDDIRLRPKSLRKRGGGGETTVETIEEEISDDNDSVVSNGGDNRVGDDFDNDDNSNSLTLKPKQIQITKAESRGGSNPFKVTAQKATTKQQMKRKKIVHHSDGDDDDDNESDGESCDGQAFEYYYEQNRARIRDDNSDVDEEDDCIRIAKQQFRQLDALDRKRWSKNALQQKSRRSSSSSKRQRKSSSVKENNNNQTTKKITNFFTKN